MSSNEQVRMYINGSFRAGDKVELADMSQSKEVYIALNTVSGFANIIIPRRHLENFMKASKPAKNKKPTTQEKLKALKIGTRFVTESNNEWIKVGEDKFIETDEELAVNGMKWHPGFVRSEDFRGKITVVEDE